MWHPAMPNLDPVIWVPWLLWLPLTWISWDALPTALNVSHRYVEVSAISAIAVLAHIWQYLAGEVVPDPYLDEVFHIPQAQAYCVGDFHIWNPKLTTPPGLYAIATFLGNMGGIRNCDVQTLRVLNVFVLTAIAAYAIDCRTLIFRHRDKVLAASDLATVHLAFNIALFPPLFFFSGLFYTDVLSTCVVLRVYRLFLQGAHPCWIYLAGLLALTMRQTNIFWVAVFLAGLEVVRALEDIAQAPSETEPSTRTHTWQDHIWLELQKYSRGQIHYVALENAEVQDLFLCAISVGVAILCHPIVIARKLWPYLALLVSFAAFVWWNGGVVLGDKSNHVATIHLSQLLYLSAFFAFFSFPLLIPSILDMLQSFLAFFIPRYRDQKGSIRSTSQITLGIVLGIITLVSTLVVIHFNTLIHPFTLADNRHYVFYVFRYTILFHPLIKYLLAPIYMLCAYLSYRTLFTPTSTSSKPTIHVSASSTSKDTNRSNKKNLQPQNQILEKRLQVPKTPLHTNPDSNPKTSFLLIYLISTTLCLITAPLVEPRYFIIPWLIWRLHVPSYTAANTAGPASIAAGKKRGSAKKRLRWKQGLWSWVSEYDYRLLIETVWFLGINMVTGYVFLYRGFAWPQEPGMVQRFMW